MAQGFAQGFASGFGLVSDVFKEKREQERQARGEAFQREQFEEQRRRADVAEARQAASDARAESAEARAADDYARKVDMDEVTRNLRLGNVEGILSHKKLGPELIASLDPKYRETYQRLESGQLTLDNLDIDTANILLAPEVRRGVGEKTRVNMNPAEKDPAKQTFKPITVTNKSIQDINVVPNSGGKLVTIDMLVEGVDDRGQRVLFTDKMTAGRQVGGEEKNIPVTGAIDYLTVGKRAAYNLFANTPAFRNIAQAYGVGMTPEQEARIADNARSNYSRILDANQKRLESLKDSDPDSFEKNYKGMSPYEAAEEVTKRYFGGMDVEQHISSTVNRIKSGSDVSQIQRVPNLGEIESRYSNLGMQFKSRDEVIRMKNDEFAAQSKWGDESVPVLGYMINALSARKGQPITFDEYRQLSREIAALKTPITSENYQGVVNQAINKMVRSDSDQAAPEPSSFRQRAGGAVSSAGQFIGGTDVLGVTGLREAGGLIQNLGETISGTPSAEKKSNQPVANISSIAPAKYAPQIESAASSNGIDPVVFAKLAKAESAFRPDIVSGKQKSSAGAVGIVQMVPKYHPNVDFNRVKTDTQYALNEGARYFSELLNRFGGDYEKAAAAYNWGPTNLSKLLANQQKAADWKKHLPGETKDYLRKIFG
jgi:soluble lytic murein transglycosylase-like protein